MISPYFEELSTEFSGLVFLKVDVDDMEVQNSVRVASMLQSVALTCAVYGDSTRARSVTWFTTCAAGDCSRVRSLRDADLSNLARRGEGRGVGRRQQGEAQGHRAEVQQALRVNVSWPGLQHLPLADVSIGVMAPDAETLPQSEQVARRALP